MKTSTDSSKAPDRSGLPVMKRNDSFVAAITRHFDGKTRHLPLACALGRHADAEGGSIFPSAKTLSIITKLSERTVKRQRKELVDSGWLICVSVGEVSAGPGRGLCEGLATKEYKISPEWMKKHSLGRRVPAPSAAENGDKNDTQNGDKLAAKRVTGRHPKEASNLQNSRGELPQPSEIKLVINANWRPSPEMLDEIKPFGSPTDRCIQKFAAWNLGKKFSPDDLLRKFGLWVQRERQDVQPGGARSGSDSAPGAREAFDLVCKTVREASKAGHGSMKPFADARVQHAFTTVGFSTLENVGDFNREKLLQKFLSAYSGYSPPDHVHSAQGDSD